MTSGPGFPIPITTEPVSKDEHSGLLSPATEPHELATVTPPSDHPGSLMDDLRDWKIRYLLSKLFVSGLGFGVAVVFLLPSMRVLLSAIKHHRPKRVMLIRALTLGAWAVLIGAFAIQANVEINTPSRLLTAVSVNGILLGGLLVDLVIYIRFLKTFPTTRNGWAVRLYYAVVILLKVLPQAWYCNTLNYYDQLLGKVVPNGDITILGLAIAGMFVLYVFTLAVTVWVTVYRSHELYPASAVSTTTWPARQTYKSASVQAQVSSLSNSLYEVFKPDPDVVGGMHPEAQVSLSPSWPSLHRAVKNMRFFYLFSFLALLGTSALILFNNYSLRVFELVNVGGLVVVQWDNELQDHKEDIRRRKRLESLIPWDMPSSLARFAPSPQGPQHGKWRESSGQDMQANRPRGQPRGAGSARMVAADSNGQRVGREGTQGSTLIRPSISTSQRDTFATSSQGVPLTRTNDALPESLLRLRMDSEKYDTEASAEQDSAFPEGGLSDRGVAILGVESRIPPIVPIGVYHSTPKVYPTIVV